MNPTAPPSSPLPRPPRHLNHPHLIHHVPLPDPPQCPRPHPKPLNLHLPPLPRGLAPPRHLVPNLAPLLHYVFRCGDPGGGGPGGGHVRVEVGMELRVRWCSEIRVRWSGRRGGFIDGNGDEHVQEGRAGDGDRAVERRDMVDGRGEWG